MTGLPSAKSIFVACGIAPSVARDLHAAEAIARSALHWGNNGEFDHLIHMRLDAEHRAVAQRVLGSASVCATLDGLLVSAPDSTRLVFRCHHLTCMYGLNRFLTHLIIERFQMGVAVPVRLIVESGARVKSLTGLGHACGTPATCFGLDHEVELADAQSCFRKVPGTRQDFTVPANVVVIRHGLEEGDIRNLGLVPHLRARRVLPYYLPG